MKTVSVFGYAKVNLFLDITGVDGGYHMLDTVVCSINLHDKIVLTKRKDDSIILRAERGKKIAGENNAVKAAELFKKTFNTKGVDITLIKKIPLGAGLGGSSADISAVLTGMKRLFELDVDIVPLANELGSDSAYQLEGGFARLKGKGEIIEPLNIDNELYMLVVPLDRGVSTKECFCKYDELNCINENSHCKTAEAVIECISKNEIRRECFYNALFEAAKAIEPKIGEAYEALKALSPEALFMSGSGSSVVAIYQTEELCEWARLKIKDSFPLCFVTRSINADELKNQKRTRSLYNESFN